MTTTQDTPEEVAPLGIDDIARYEELEQMIAPLVKEFETLKSRFKAEIPDGKFPADEYLVHRWDQTGGLKDAVVFFKAYDPDEHPEMWTHKFVGKIEAELPPEEHPDLYKKVPDEAAIKELLPEEEKGIYLKQIPYLKIRRLAPGEVIDDE